jgi:hypothetical protein
MSSLFSCHLKKVGFEKHVKSVHDKIKDHKYNLCNFTLSRRQSLVGHVKAVHDKIKDSKCNLCDFATSHPGSLMGHVKSV